MTPIYRAVLLGFVLATVTHCGQSPPPPRPAREAATKAHLTEVGPRLISNQTKQPLQIYGEHLTDGLRLRLGAPVNREIGLVVVDEGHAFGVLPSGIRLRREDPRVRVPVSLIGKRGEAQQGQVEIQIVNDTEFPDPFALATSRDGHLFVLSPTTDTMFVVDPSGGAVHPVPTADGPRAIAPWIDPAGREWMAVVHEFSAELRLYAADDRTAAPRVLVAPSTANGLVVDAARGIAFIAERARDTIVALDLAHDGRQLWRTPVLPNPREMVVAGDRLAVGSFLTGSVEILEAATGTLTASITPGPGTPIVGGHTADFSPYVMSGTAPRSLVWSDRLDRIFLTSIGPNIGPNPQKMEVSMNGGIAVIDPAGARYERHLGFPGGVPEGMALDDTAGLLYVADIGLGVVRVLDAVKLARSDATATSALVQVIPVPPTDGFPLARPRGDYGVQGRAGAELHSGPRALVLDSARTRLMVLNRFTGTIATIDVSGARTGQARLVSQAVVTDTLGQRQRRLGEVLYFADMGRTGMSCDACHPEGHVGGMLFEKTTPLRIYRSTSILGSFITPPFFIPASTHSLEETASFVGARNRFQNPAPTREEVAAIALFAGCIPTPPNPFLGPDGAPVDRLDLPDGTTGNPRRGMKLFESRAGCTGCHPAPHFTNDQDTASRGQYQTVGTPLLMPLRPTLQDRGSGTFPPPSLLGGWDMFPMFSTGTAGLEVTPEGALRANTRFPLRAAIESSPRHGSAGGLDPAERNDLLAYLMSL